MKYIKWFLVSSFLILFLGVCNVVSALELTNKYLTTSNISGYDQNRNGFYIKNNINLANDNTIQFTLTDVNINNYDYVDFNLYFNYNQYISSTYSGTETITGSNFTCTYWTYKEMTYADGTKSQYYVCDEFTGSGSEPVTGNTSTPFVTKVGIMVDLLMDNNYWTTCSISNDSMGISVAHCPLATNRTSLSRIRIRNMGISPQIATGSIGVENQLIFYKDPINSMTQKQDETNNQLQDMNDNITSTDVSGASQDQSNIVNNPAFQDNTGLSGIITAPLSMISSLTNQCQPIQLTLPYLKDTNVSIPCMGNFLQSKLPALVTLIKVFVNGFICYLIGLDLFKIVKNARDPDNDRIEVLDL